MKSYDGRSSLRPGTVRRLALIAFGMLVLYLVAIGSACKRERNPDADLIAAMGDWLLMQQPDPSCTASDYTGLISGQPVQTTGKGYFGITPLNGQMVVKITLQGSACTLGRHYYYCANGQLHEGDPQPDSPGMACSDGNDSRLQDITGPVGTSESCDLSFPGDRYLIYIYDYSATSCTYEIRLN